jgi:phospholipid transport system substrate-binding protein
VEILGEHGVGSRIDDEFAFFAGTDNVVRITEFRRLFLIGLDFRTIGRFVLGRHWRRATRDEIRAFEALFAEYVVTTYAMRLARYQIDTRNVGEVRADGQGGAVVTSEIIPRDGARARIEWRVRGKPGNYKIIDVVIEGISMAINQRSEFASVIQRGGGEFDSLLTQLRKRTNRN